jgi:hypothetical protein
MYLAIAFFQDQVCLPGENCPNNAPNYTMMILGIGTVIVVYTLVYIFGGEKQKAGIRNIVTIVGIIALVVGCVAGFFEHFFESIIGPIIVVGILISWALGFGSIFGKKR